MAKLNTVIRYDDELADRIAEKCARMCCTIAFGPSGQAPLGPISWREARERGIISNEEYQEAMDSRQFLPDNTWPPSRDSLITPEGDDSGAISAGDAAVFMFIVLSAIALKRPSRVAGSAPSRFFRFKLPKRLKETAARQAENAGLLARHYAPRVRQFLTGYLSNEAIDAAVSGAVKIRGVNVPSRATWSQIFLGMKHVIMPVIMDELVKSMLPQEPQSPRKPSKNGVTRPGRRSPGPPVRAG